MKGRKKIKKHEEPRNGACQWYNKTTIFSTLLQVKVCLHMNYQETWLWRLVVTCHCEKGYYLTP